MTVTYIISDIDKALAFEWIADGINQQKFTLSFILINPGNSILEEYIKQKGFKVERVTSRSKKDWPAAFIKTYTLLKSWKPDAVHCHLIQATIIGLPAAKLAGVRKRIYTRHHSSLHHIYFKKGVWWDKLSNKLATHIVAIAGVVKDILIQWEKADPRKVFLIPHGFRLDAFDAVAEDRITAFKTRYDLVNKGPVAGVISRFTEWKGVQYIIPAFQRLLQHFPNAVLLLLNAKGDYEEQITTLLQPIPLKNYRLIPFEKDVMAAYKCMDVFVHTPIDEHSEAFGQIYVEALAAELPSIFTLSGIAPDFILDGSNAFVVPFRNPEQVYEKLLFVLKNYDSAKEVARKGKKNVQYQFSLHKMIHALEALYEQC